VEVVSDLAEPDALARCEEAVVLSRGPGDGISQELARLRHLRRLGIPRRWGYGVRGLAGLGLPGLLLRWLLAPAVRPPFSSVLQARHRSEDFRELLQAMEVPPPASWVPRLEIGDEARRAARERLERGGIPADASPVVALIPGGRLVASARERIPPASRWPWQCFAGLTRELRQRVAGLRCLLVAGREPLWPAVRVHEETARFVPLIGPDLDAFGLAALLAVSDLAVAADGELLHLAAAVGTPTVALFGPTDPRRRAPRGEHHRLLAAPGGDLRRLEAPTVLETALEVLDAF